MPRVSNRHNSEYLRFTADQYYGIDRTRMIPISTRTSIALIAGPTYFKSFLKYTFTPLYIADHGAAMTHKHHQPEH